MPTFRSFALSFAACSALVLPLACFSSCASSDALYADASGRRSGQKVFERRCATCHVLPDPAVRTAVEWRLVMRRMAVEAALDANDRALVTDWLAANSRSRRQ